MKKAILLAATLALLSAPAFAQMSRGGTDRSLGNGNVESARPGMMAPMRSNRGMMRSKRMSSKKMMRSKGMTRSKMRSRAM